MFMWIVWMFGFFAAFGLLAGIDRLAVYALAPVTAKIKRRD